MTAESSPGQPVILDIMGVRVEVTAAKWDGVSLRAAAGELVVDGSSNGRSSVGGVHCAVEVDAAALEEVLGAALRAAIEHSPDLLLHAGVVACGGQVVLLPGESGTGKSTMTAACLLHGFGYLSDEAAAVNLATGTVTGLSRPLMLTPWAVEALGIAGAAGDVDGELEPATGTGSVGKLAVPAARLGAPTLSGALPVNHVVVHGHGAPVTRMTPMSTGETLTALLASSFNHYRHGEAAWVAAATLATSSQGWRLDAADPHSAAELIAGLFSPD